MYLESVCMAIHICMCKGGIIVYRGVWVGHGMHLL